MSRRSNGGHRSSCPINISLELFGDRWSLLIVRDLMFRGTDSFGGFLAAPESIATNILADRLRKLEAAGIVEKSANPEDARSVRYRLTAKGMDLAPVLVEIILWAARHEDTGAPPEMVAEMTSDRKRFIDGIRKRWAAANDEKARA